MGHLFDCFTIAELLGNPRLKDEVLRFLWDYYAAFQHQRSAALEKITTSLLQATVGRFQFTRWMRVVDYRYTNSPLSAAGSVVSMTGGRFNIGDIDRMKFSPFPALYLASDQETALVEKFGQQQNPGDLTQAELALRSDRSYTCTALNGSLDTVIDLSRMDRLTAFVEIVRHFTISAELRARARRLLRRSPLNVTTVEELRHTLLAANWRADPVQASVPHSCQVFGQLAACAGIEGIVFPSTRSAGGNHAMAIFPLNLQGDSFVELADKEQAPAATTQRRLDATNRGDCGCFERARRL